LEVIYPPKNYLKRDKRRCNCFGDPILYSQRQTGNGVERRDHHHLGFPPPVLVALFLNNTIISPCASYHLNREPQIEIDRSGEP